MKTPSPRYAPVHPRRPTIRADARHRYPRLILPALLLELAAGGAQPAAPPRLDLRGLDPCAKGSSEEVVVCGSRTARSPYRLPRLDDDKYAGKHLHPENVVPGGRIHADSSVRSDGLVDERIMITFTVPF